MQMPEKTPHAPGLTSCSEKECMVGQASADSVLPGDSEIPNSFAPEGFVFEAPASWSAFKFEPLTPCSADAFVTSRFFYLFIVYNALIWSCIRLVNDYIF